MMINEQIKPLLDFIGQLESNGNYRVVFGGRVIPNLTDMTISQVYSNMNSMLDEQRRTRGRAISTASGKYQIIRTTLQGLMNDMRLNPDTTIFSEQTQDHFAIQLLRWRGIHRYLNGSLSIEQFATNIAKEWASIPIQNGRSYYNDGINKSLTTYDEVIRVLTLIKS